MRDGSRRPSGLGAFATGSPRPVECRKLYEAGLLACAVPFRASPTPSRRLGSGCVDAGSAYSCGGSRGLANKGAPRSRLSSGPRRRTSNRQGYAVPGSRSTAVLTDVNARDFLARFVWVPFLLQKVKRETGKSRCCPRNGKRGKRLIHCASSSAWEGDATVGVVHPPSPARRPAQTSIDQTCGGRATLQLLGESGQGFFALACCR